MLKSTLKLLLSLVFTCGAALAIPTRAASRDLEAAPLGCDEFLAAMGLHGPLFSVFLTSNPMAVEDFYRSGPVREFLKARDPDLLVSDPWDGTEAISAYLDRALAEYTIRRKMALLRKNSLQQALAARGLDVPSSRSPRHSLVAASRRNKQRLLGGRTYTPGRTGFEQAEAVVERLGPVFTHNAPRAVQVPESLLLSARQLTYLGFSGGLNTSEFNQWLQADDHVFFFVHLARTGQKTVRAFSQRNMSLAYGNSEAVLAPDFAAKNAWISAYVMDPDDLLEFGDARHPEMTRETRRYIAQRFGTSDSRIRMIDELADTLAGATPSSIWQRVSKDNRTFNAFRGLRDALGQLDFTVADFTDLLRTQLLLALEEIRRQKGERAFQKRIAQLEQGTPLELAGALKELFYAPLGLPRDFELKVPVAVPPAALAAGPGR